ncbi:MAG: hypothetical protein OHK0057_27750 [Thermoflexibacter sp.]
MDKLKNATQFFNTLNILFYGLMSGGLIFFLITYLAFQSNQLEASATELVSIFNYIVPFVCIMEFGLAVFLFDLTAKKIPSMDSLKEKLSAYFRGKLIQWALIESGGLFAIVAYFLTGNQMYALWYLSSVMVLAFYRATPPNFYKYAQLSQKEHKVMENNLEIE